MSSERTGAIGALLDEYEKAIKELQAAIAHIPNGQLTEITDKDTPDENCRSIQAILTHVVSAGYNYATQIANHKGVNLIRRPKMPHASANEYIRDLDEVFAFTAGVLQGFQEDELLEHDNSRKILVSWGQSYDIEQLMEHAIVHILRHRRQIERIKNNMYDQ